MKKAKKKAAKKMAKRTRPTTTDPRACSLQDFAELVGRSLPTIQAFIRRGMPSRGRRGRTHLVEIGPAVRWILEEQERRCEEQLASADPRLAKARARKYEADAEIREMEAARRRGELVSKAEVVAEGQRFVRAWRARLLALPRQLIQAGAVERAREAQLTTQIHLILTEISGWTTDALLGEEPKRAKKEKK